MRQLTADRAIRRGSVGLGWRREFARFIERAGAVDFLEITAENHPPDSDADAALAALLAKGRTVVVHGTGLSLGSGVGLEPRRLQALASCARRFRAPLVSEHVAFTRSSDLEIGHLMPLPRTHVALSVLCDNIRRTQDALHVPLALENIAALFEWPDPEMGAADFLAAALERTGAALLLDAANLYADVVNFGLDAESFLDSLPLARTVYAHVAGGILRHGVWHDTHAHALTEPILEIVAQLLERAPGTPLLLERDDRFPSDADLLSELDALRALTMRSAGHARA